YVGRGAGRFGPFSAAQLRQLAAAGRLRATDTVWKEGMKKGVLAARVKNLFPAPATEAPPPSASAPGAGGTPSPPQPAGSFPPPPAPRGAAGGGGGAGPARWPGSPRGPRPRGASQPTRRGGFAAPSVARGRRPDRPGQSGSEPRPFRQAARAGQKEAGGRPQG